MPRHVPGAAEPPRSSGHVQFLSSCGYYTTPTQFNSQEAFEHVLPPVEPSVSGESFVPGDRAGIEHRDTVQTFQPRTAVCQLRPRSARTCDCEHVWVPFLGVSQQ